MKILILGADGMLGHQLIESYRGKHETVGTYRRSSHNYTDLTNYLAGQCYYNIEATDFHSIKKLIAHVNPTAVINAIGIVKQRDKEQEIISSIKNSRSAVAASRVGGDRGYAGRPGGSWSRAAGFFECR